MVFTLQSGDLGMADQYLKHVLISNLDVNFLALRSALDINFHLAWYSLWAERYDSKWAGISFGKTMSSSDFKTNLQRFTCPVKRYGSMKYLCLRQWPEECIYSGLAHTSSSVS